VCISFLKYILHALAITLDRSCMPTLASDFGPCALLIKNTNKSHSARL
jgi:hypothetical protein